MGNCSQFFLFFFLVMVKWDFVVSDYEVPVGIISSAVLPNDDEYEVEEKTELANVMRNQIPVQEHLEMIPYIPNGTPGPNRLLDLSVSSGSAVDVYSSITRFVSQLKLTPDKTSHVEIIPPRGSKNEFLNTLMGDLKEIVPKLISNAPVSFKLGATKNADDTLSKIQLDIIVGSAVKETFNRFGNDEIPKSNILTPINVDLTSQSINPEITLTSALENGVNNAKPYIVSGKPSEMIFHITPPSGFSTSDQQNTIRTITRLLNNIVPSNVRTIVQGRSINNPDGTVKMIDVKIILQPTTILSGENIEIDLSKSGNDIPKTLEDNLVMIVQNENSRSVNLIIIPPSGTTPESSRNIINMVNSILIRLIPNRKPEVHYKISQGSNGYVDKIYVKVDTEPSSSPENQTVLHFDADLSNPTENLKEYILRIIPKIKNVISKQQNEQPVSFTLNIKPPKGATDEYVTNTLTIMQKTLSDALPQYKIGVKARITKDSQGNITNISLTSTIEPVSRNTENELSVNLSKPGTNLIDYLIKVTPQLKEILDKEQPEHKPASMTLNVQPPAGATDQFVRNSMNTVTSFLTKLLPDKEISVQAKATKDINGNIINTSLYITAEPGTPTEQPTHPGELTFDLSDPKVNLDDIILHILPHLQKQVNEDNTENKPRSFFLNIIPPKGSGIQFAQNTMNYIANKLSKYLPNDKIGVQSKITKNSDGNIVNIGLNIIAEQKYSNEEPKNRKTFNIDLSFPGKDIDEQIIQIIPSIQSITQQQPNNEPIECNLNIRPPKGATDDFVKVVTDKVRTDLKKVLPNKNIKIQPQVKKDAEGNIINIVLITSIEPENANVTKNENGDIVFTIDLKKPGTNFETQITNIVPYITDVLKKNPQSKEPKNFILKIISPKGKDTSFVKTTMQTIRDNLSRIYPDRSIGIKAKATKDSEGYITDLEFDVTFEPTSTTNETGDNPFIENVVTPETTTTNKKTITVNLNKPGLNLEQEIINVVPTLKQQIQENEITNEPNIFNINIVPPKGVKENFVKETTNYIITTLSHFFPENKIGLKAKTTKDEEGNIMDIRYIVNIEHREPLDMKDFTTEKPKTITVNFEKPGVDLSKEINEKLPTLKYDVDESKNTDKPVTFEMNIQPPKGAKDDFVKNTMNDVITTISHLFPNNKVGVKAKATKDDKGNIIDVSYEVNILPAPSSDETQEELNAKSTTPLSHGTGEEIFPRTTASEGLIEVTEVTTKKPKTITVNFEKPGVDLTKEINEKLPTLKYDVEKSKDKNKPVTFEMNIQPPKGAKDDFVKNTMNDVITTISHLFPNNKVGVKAKATKDDKGNIIDVSYEVNILPAPSSDETPEELNTKSTTPSSHGTGEEIFPRTTASEGLIEVTEVTTKKPKTITVNFENPGVDLSKEINEKLPTLKYDVEESKDNNKPVTFEMNIQPPKGAKDDFVKNTMNDVITTISHLFPNNKVGVKAKATKDDKGNIIDVSYEVNILPVTSSKETQEELNAKSTTPSSHGTGEEIFPRTTASEGLFEVTEVTTKKPKTITVNFEKPGVDLTKEINEKLPTLKYDVDESKNTDKPVTFEMNIQPPKGAKDDFVKNTMNDVITTISHLFPNNKVGVKAKATKDDKGNIIDVSYEVNILPVTSSKETQEELNAKSTTPSSHGTGEEIFPRTTAFEGLIEVTEVTTKKPKTITVNFEKPGVDLTKEINEKLPTLKYDVEENKDKNKPVTFEMNIQPPKGAKDDFVKNTMNDVITTISHLFPNNKVGVKAKATKDDKGNIIDVSYEVNILPAPSSDETPEELNTKSTTPSSHGTGEEIFPRTTASEGLIEVTEVTTKKPKTITVNFEQPGVDLTKEINEKLPTLKYDVEENKDKNKPVTFEMNVQPPKGAKDDFVKNTMNDVITTISHLFPNNKVGVKAKATKDDKGNIIDVSYEVNILPVTSSKETQEELNTKSTTPSSHGTGEEIFPRTTASEGLIEVTEVTTKKPKTITVNFEKPGVDLSKEINEKLPTLEYDVEESKNTDKPVTFEMNIQPPKGAQDDFVKDTSNDIITTLSHLFPNNKIGVKAKTTKDDKGNIIDVSYEVNIIPTSTESHENNENIDLTEQTTRHHLETTTISESQEETVEVNLTKPGSGLPEEVEEILPKIITPLNENLKQGNQVTLNFVIDPPPKSTDDFLKTAPQSLFPILTKYFPNNKINFKTTGKKNSEGFLTEVVLSVNIEPSNELETTTRLEIIDLVVTTKPEEPNQTTTPEYHDYNENIDLSELTTRRQPETTTSNESQEKTVDVDLSKPGSSLPEEVEAILPKIISPLEENMKQGNPVTLTFDIEPPSKSTEDFLNTAPQSLVPILSKYFPNNKINVKTTGKKNAQGFLTDVVLSINIEPSNEPKTTTPAETVEKNIDIDVSQPDSSLPEQFDKMLPKIIEPVKNDLREGNPVNLNFNINPPPRSTKEFLQTAPQSLVPILSKYFPNNKISLKTNAKENSQGYLTDIILSVNIEPSDEPETTTPAETLEENIDIDVSQPDSSLPEQFDKMLPKIIEPVKNDLGEGKPVNLNFNINPPPRSTSEFLQTAAQSLVPILSKYFPNNKISLKTNAKENSQGYLTDVILSVNIEPSNEPKTTTPAETVEKNIDIDVSQPDSSLPEQFDKILPKIIEPVKNDLREGNTVNLNFNINPPARSTREFLQTAPQSLVPILSKYFPNNKISLKTNAKENSQGYLTDVILSVNIEPSSGEPETTTPAASIEKNIDIDVSQPDSSLPEQFDKMFPKIIEPVKNDLREGNQVNLNFNIDPPPRSTSEFLQTAPQSLVPILSKYFPNNKINLKTTSQENSQGFLTNVVLSVNIEPNNEIKKTVQNIAIDLTKPASSLPEEINQILPTVLEPIEINLKEGTPTTINFDIDPPLWSTSDFLKTAPQSVVPILSKYFPNNKISLKTKAKQNPNGFLTDVVLSVIIEPNNETTSKPKERNVDIDLTQPGSTLPGEMNNIIQFIVSPVKEDLKKANPVTLKFNIEPPPRSTADFLQSAPQSIVSILTNHFPTNKMSLKTNAKKNSLGYLSDVVLSITIEPSEDDVSNENSEQNNEGNINIDLSQPGTSISNTVNILLPNVIPNVQEGLKNQLTQTIEFNIQPPQGATQGDLQSYADSLMPILSSYFPNNQISVKAKAQTNSQGYLTFATLIVTIEPASQSQEESSGLRINLDFSNQYSSMSDQVNQVMPSIINYVQNQPQNGQALTLNFNIKLPRWVSEEYIKSVTNYLQSTLSSSFPQSRLEVQISKKTGSEGLGSVLQMKVTLMPEEM